MRSYLLIIPIAFLVACSQVLIKLHSGSAGHAQDEGLLGRLLNFALDPVVMAAYAAALVASFAWLFVVADLPLTIAFPVYIGVTFLMVVIGGCLFLSETLSAQKVAAMILIVGGIALGLSSNA